MEKDELDKLVEKTAQAVWDKFWTVVGGIFVLGTVGIILFVVFDTVYEIGYGDGQNNSNAEQAMQQGTSGGITVTAATSTCNPTHEYVDGLEFYNCN